MENKKVTTEVRRSKGSRKTSHWLIWWQVDDDAISQEAEGYQKLKFIHTSRGVSVLLILFTVTLTTIFSVFKIFGYGLDGLFDVFVFLVLALFIYKGHKWAMISAMILWTLEKFYAIAIQVSSGTPVGATVIIQIIWWSIFMHVFYTAYKVEKARTSKLQVKIKVNHNLGYCPNCGKEHSTEAKFCTNCGVELKEA